MAFGSRIKFAYDGNEKLSSIDETLEKYGGLTSSELVNLTHKEDSPWEKSYDGTKFKIIPDDLILNNHHVEEVMRKTVI